MIAWGKEQSKLPSMGWDEKFSDVMRAVAAHVPTKAGMDGSSTHDVHRIVTGANAITADSSLTGWMPEGVQGTKVKGRQVLSMLPSHSVSMWQKM